MSEQKKVPVPSKAPVEAEVVELPQEAPLPNDVREWTVEQLKAQGYDQVRELERIQANLRTINAEITRREGD